MYRDIVKVSKSLYRMSYALPSVWLAFKLGRLSGYFLEHMINTMGVAGRDYRVRLQDDLQLGVVLNSIVMGTYLDLRRDGHTDIAAIRYEDLVSNPAESLRRILEYCRLPAELVEPGLRGLEVDSQRNSVIAKSTIGGLREPELTPEAIATANLMLKKFGLPLIGEECLIDGTITYIKSKSSADTNKKSTGQS